MSNDFFNVIGMLVVGSSIVCSVSSMRSSSTTTTRTVITRKEEPTIIKPTSETVDDLQNIKEKLNEINPPQSTESYTVQGNPGLSIGGTVLEQLLEISITFFKQPLVNEALQKIIKDESDAKVITDMIKEFGEEIVNSLKDNQVLSCAKKFNCEERIVDDPDPDDGLDVVGGSRQVFCEDTKLNNWEHALMYVSDKKKYSTDKVKNCDRYVPNLDSLQNIKNRVTGKAKGMLTDPSKTQLFYNTVVSIGKNNMDFISSHLPKVKHQMNERGNPFDDDGEFIQTMPFEKFKGFADELSQKL
jgi:hypothetical protein